MKKQEPLSLKGSMDSFLKLALEPKKKRPKPKKKKKSKPSEQ